MQSPYYLYHYTRINTLAQILSSRKLRLSSLNTVNDPSEGQSSDMGDLGMFVFVSCWTEASEENLVLWNMYTPQMRGVRIRLPMPLIPMFEHEGKKNYVPFQDWITDSHMILPNHEHVRKVQYTDDPELLKPNTVVDMNTNTQGISIKKLARYKRPMWSIEQEWRFVMSIFPRPQNKSADGSFQLNDFTELIDNKNPDSLGYSHYDVPFDNDCFNQMEVTLGPRVESGDEEIVESLIDKYNPSASLRRSSLTDLIRT